jgi:hypothetical protein
VLDSPASLCARSSLHWRAPAGAFAFFTEMTDSCLLLLRAKKLPASFALERVALLGLADLHNLKKDPRYPLHMDAKRISEWERLLEGAQKWPNPLLADMAEEYDLAEEAAKLRATGVETREAGGQGLSDAERLRLAGFEHEHGSVYWLWSLYAHANFGAIAGAHVTHDGRFTFRPKDDLRELVTSADGLTGMAIGAMYAVFPQFDLQTDVVDELSAELSAVRLALGLNDGPRSPADE